MFFMVSPLLLHYHLVDKNSSVSFGQIIGLFIMTAGILIEATADYQKSQFKLQHPTEFCSTGLYQYLRMPNYFGEITFHHGGGYHSFFPKEYDLYYGKKLVL